MPYRLDSLLVMPQTTDFVDTDRQQLTAVLSDLLGAISHRRDENWNGHVGEFTSRFIKRQRRCGYIEFPWHDVVESAVIAAECSARALQPLRNSPRPWIELAFGIEFTLSHDNLAIKHILNPLKPLYMNRARFRTKPALHGHGDVTIQDWSLDLLAELKRIVPGEDEDRDVVECYIKRFPKGRGRKVTEAEFTDSHDRHVVFYEEYAIPR